MARDELAPLRAYLQARTTLTLATCSGGRPWACSLFYACDRDCRLYFVSDARTLHCLHIAENPQVAVTVSGQALDWLDIEGVQLVATATLLEGAQRRRAEQCYLERFPQIAAMRPELRLQLQAVANVLPFRVNRYVLEELIDRSWAATSARTWSTSTT